MEKLLKKIGMQGFIKITMVAAIYVVSTVTIGDIGYGDIQFRISEVLNFLAFIDPFYIFGLTLGCMISNFFGPLGIIDALVGGSATFIVTCLMYKSKNLFIASLFPMLNGPIIALMLMKVYGLPWLTTALFIAISEFIIMSIIGYPVFKQLFNNKSLVKQLKIDKTNIKYL